MELEVKTSNEETPDKHKLVPINDEHKDVSVSWAQKQLMKIRAFFTQKQHSQPTQEYDSQPTHNQSENGDKNPEITNPIHAALYDFQSRIEENLNFERGDLLCIVDASDEDWWLAHSKDEKDGYVPSNYLTPLAVDPKTTLHVHK